LAEYRRHGVRIAAADARTGRPEMRAGLMGTCRSLSIHVTRCVHVRHLGQEVNNIVILLAGTSKH
jgi:hypothetical protein